jgi:hypothetical protein
MNDTSRGNERLLLRIGGVAAIPGAVLQVAAGTSQTVRLDATTAVVLPALAEQPDWAWPVIAFSFIFGALLWVIALVALTSTLNEGASWVLGRLALVMAIVGVTLHALDGALNAVALEGLARSWGGASETERATLTQHGDLLLRILASTWAVVITLYHGLPFVLAGLAVAMSPRYPAWLGWIGVIGGAGSLIIGLAMLLGVQTLLAVPFAVVLSFFMVILGWLLWEQAGRTPPAIRPI